MFHATYAIANASITVRSGRLGTVPGGVKRLRVAETEVADGRLGKGHAQEEVLVVFGRMDTGIGAVLDRGRGSGLLHVGGGRGREHILGGPEQESASREPHGEPDVWKISRGRIGGEVGADGAYR